MFGVLNRSQYLCSVRSASLDLFPQLEWWIQRSDNWFPSSSNEKTKTKPRQTSSDLGHSRSWGLQLWSSWCDPWSEARDPTPTLMALLGACSFLRQDQSLGRQKLLLAKRGQSYPLCHPREGGWQSVMELVAKSLFLPKRQLWWAVSSPRNCRGVCGWVTDAQITFIECLRGGVGGGLWLSEASRFPFPTPSGCWDLRTQVFGTQT